MRIGFFTETYHPQVNGVVVTTDLIGSELVKRGHEVHVFAPKTNLTEKNGMIIHSCPAIGFKPYPGYKIAIPVGMKIPELDIVHTHGPFSMGRFGVKIAKKQGIPKVTTYHTLLSEYVDYVSKYGKMVTSRIATKYCEHHYNKYDKVIVLSNAIKNSLPEKLQKKSVLIPTGIDVKKMKPVPNARKKLGIKQDKVYLHLGRISPEKDIDVLLKAAGEFVGKKDILFIAGNGPAYESLKKQAKKLKLGNKVKFLGFVSDEEKLLYYSAADLFITASESETQGIVVNEALACGTPVLGANAMAVPESITEGYNGFLFPPGDYKQLARTVKNIKFTEKMRENARKTALNLSIEKTVDRYEELYKGLIDRN